MLMQVLSLMDAVPDTPPTPEEEEAYSKDPDTILARIVRDLFMDEDAAKTTLAVSASFLYMPSAPPPPPSPACEIVTAPLLKRMSVTSLVPLARTAACVLVGGGIHLDDLPLAIFSDGARQMAEDIQAGSLL